MYYASWNFDLVARGLLGFSLCFLLQNKVKRKKKKKKEQKKKKKGCSREGPATLATVLGDEHVSSRLLCESGE